MKTQYYKQAKIGNIIGIVAGIAGLLMFIPLLYISFHKGWLFRSIFTLHICISAYCIYISRVRLKRLKIK
jgi:hypothetical protein